MKKILVITLCLAAACTVFALDKFTAAERNHKKKIALIIALQDFQPKEYGDTKQVLSHAGFSVITVSTKPSIARATDGSKVFVDEALNKFDYTKYEGIFIIGGPGAHTELDKEPVYTIMQEAYKAGKIIGAICYSPRILAKAGILTNKKATGWNDDHELDAIFKQYNVQYVHEPVVIDGTIITADGPMSAKDFGKAIVDMIERT